MFCNNCGNKLDGENKFCPVCGAKNDKELGNNTENLGKANVVLVIASFLVPILGLILFATDKDKNPKNSKACGIAGIVGFVINIILVFTTTLFTAILPIFNEIKTDSTSDPVFKTTTTTKSSSNDNEVEGSANWTDYTISINGNTLSLPITYSSFEDIGLQMKDNDKEKILAKNKYTIVNIYKDSKLSFYIHLLNDTTNELSYKDCQVSNVSQSRFQVKTSGADAIVFPGGLTVGSNIDEEKIIELFGEPTKKRDYSNDDYKSETYVYAEDEKWTTFNNLEIRVVDGVIDEISLDHREY